LQRYSHFLQGGRSRAVRILNEDSNPVDTGSDEEDVLKLHIDVKEQKDKDGQVHGESPQ
jgi:hypothetical protein